MIRLGMALALSLISVGAQAFEPCAGVTDIKSKSRQIYETKALMPQLMMLQGQGEAKFHPTFAPPRSQCSFEKFDAAGNSVERCTPRSRSWVIPRCCGSSSPEAPTREPSM